MAFQTGIKGSGLLVGCKNGKSIWHLEKVPCKNRKVLLVSEKVFCKDVGEVHWVGQWHRWPLGKIVMKCPHIEQTYSEINIFIIHWNHTSYGKNNLWHWLAMASTLPLAS